MRVLEPKTIGTVSAANGARHAAGASGVRFSLPGSPNTQKAESAAPAAIMGGLEALIAIRAEDTTREKKRRSVKRGQGLLDLLDELKLSLLGGRLPPDMAARLAQAGRDDQLSGDSKLDDIVGGIELRAAVELAKLRAREKMLANKA